MFTAVQSCVEDPNWGDLVHTIPVLDVTISCFIYNSKFPNADHTDLLKNRRMFIYFLLI